MKKEFTTEQREILDILAKESYETWINEMEAAAYLENTFTGKGGYLI